MKRLFKLIKSYILNIKSVYFTSDYKDDPAVFDKFLNNFGKRFNVDHAVDLPEPIIYGNVESNKVMLLMDDQEAVFYLYEMDFIKIKSRYDYDVLSEFKIVKCQGLEAGFIAEKYLDDNTDEIVVALLDLTLGKIMVNTKGVNIILDGVDIAVKILNTHSKCKIGVCTAHMLEETNPALTSMIRKFRTLTGCNLLDYAFNKNDDRATYIYNLLMDIDELNYDMSTGQHCVEET